MKRINRIHVLLFPLAVLFAMLMMPAGSVAQVSITVSFAPPALPVYEQPPCPGEGYIWTPGYWAYDSDVDDYYWVPGTWVSAPEPDYYWTPAYWAFENGVFLFHDGYWGPEVGFYGGIDYGYGYPGDGYYGGRWERGHFFYNREVNNVNVTVVKNVYVQNVVRKTVVNRVSYNGDGGVNARPTPAQEAAARARHLPPAQAQVQHIREARQDQQLRASVNQGKPPVAATEKPAAFKGHDVVPAKEAGAPYRPPAKRAANGGKGPAGRPESNNNNARPENNAHANNNNARPENNARPDNNPRPENNARPEGNNNGRPATAVHPKDLPPRERPAPVNTGNAKQDQKNEQRQEKLEAKQRQQRQKLEQKQEQEHQKMQRQGADQARNQQMEQRHQQQTQKLEQKQEQQRAKAQPKQQAPKQGESRQQKEQRPPS